METLISGNKPKFSDWLTGYTTNLVTTFNNTVINANNEYNTLNNGKSTNNDPELAKIFSNITGYTEKYKKAQINLYDY